MTFSYVVSAFDSNFSLFIRSSSNINSISGLDDVILDQKAGGGAIRIVMVFIFSRK